MRESDYWNLFWLSGLPEAWIMSRAEPRLSRWVEEGMLPPERIVGAELSARPKQIGYRGADT